MDENTNSTEKKLSITATPIEGKNYVHLEWTNLGAGYTYTIYSKGQGDTVYQSIPSKSNIKVLNVYPDKGNNLKGWMENPNSESINGYGKGLISVDEVSISNFNTNPTSYVKDNRDNWKYDVLYIGAWDGNNLKDISIEAVNVVQEFIESGRGYLGGHDTMGVYWPRELSSFNISLLRPYLNIKLGVLGLPKEAGDENYYSEVDFPQNFALNIDGSNIRIKKKGLLTNYPWVIGDVESSLTIPYTHTSAQFAYGDIWMDFIGKGSVLAPDGKGEGNFYLTTWNNTAMVQTGNSNGAATPDEQKLLANTLFYLAQLTNNNFCDDHKGQDLTVPDKVTITNAATDGKGLNITYSKPSDNGTKYEYYVKASNGNVANDITSNTVSITNTSGLAGYSYVIDNVENTEPDNKIHTTDLSISTSLSGVDLLKPIYIHINAIDNAGNASETTHYKYIYAVSLKLDKTEITLKEEASEQITAITDSESMGITWTSSDTSVATVDENGKVTAVKKGQAIITATIKGRNLSAACTVTVKKKIILNIEPQKDKIHLKENVVVNYTIDNIKEIAAEDAIIKYDNTKLKFIGMSEAKEIKLIKIEEDEDELRIITASDGLSTIINDKKILLKLYFKGIASGEALVDVIKGKVTDGIEMEKDLYDSECGQAAIIIDDILVEDVNRSGEFTLLDLGIDARHLGEDPKTLPEYNTDQIVNGAIDNDDLSRIGEYMLENPYYKFK